MPMQVFGIELRAKAYGWRNYYRGREWEKVIETERERIREEERETD